MSFRLGTLQSILNTRLKPLVPELERQIGEFDDALADPETYKNSARIKEITTQKAAAQRELDDVMEQWMEAQAELDEAMKAFG